MTELRARVDAGDEVAKSRLDEALATLGDELVIHEIHPEDVDWVELRVLAGGQGDEAALAELRTLVLSGSAGLALLGAYRTRWPDRQIAELDCEAQPVYTDSP